MTTRPPQNKIDRNKIDGWVILDKPLHVTSTKAVNMVRHCFNAAKAGHAGTLDPLASGILPIALGEATKTIPYVVDGTSKDYGFTVSWGAATDTDDREGAVIETHDHRPTEADINAILPQFTGLIDQVPPIYSAIKKDGRRAYDMARNNEQVTLSSRKIDILSLRCVAASQDEASFVAVTGKGAYIRSLGRDMARALGTVGHISDLRRLRVGLFSESQSIPLDFFEKIDNSADAFKALHPVSVALDDIPALTITEADASRLRRGQKIEADSGLVLPPPIEGSGDVVMAAYCQGHLVAMVSVCGGTVFPVRVFNLS